MQENVSFISPSLDSLKNASDKSYFKEGVKTHAEKLGKFICSTTAMDM